jgi:hypothetical protein
MGSFFTDLGANGWSFCDDSRRKGTMAVLVSLILRRKAKMFTSSLGIQLVTPLSSERRGSEIFKRRQPRFARP